MVRRRIDGRYLQTNSLGVIEFVQTSVLRQLGFCTHRLQFFDGGRCIEWFHKNREVIDVGWFAGSRIVEAKGRVAGIKPRLRWISLMAYNIPQ